MDLKDEKGLKFIFLFSLPRSGSTLLQKILMSHPKIASIAEPWLLLPFIYATKKEGILAEYSHAISYEAIQNFIRNLPNGKKEFYEILRLFFLKIYKKHCRKEETYFLDKTPRYYLIIPEISEIFPEAKFIFLFRNPVQVIASIISTWGNYRFNNLYPYYIDVLEGPNKMAQGYKLLKNRSYMLTYEDFVISPKKYLLEILDYLELDYSNQLINEMLNFFYTQDLKGNLGDRTGIKKYKKISKNSLTRWKKVFNSRFRKKFLLKHLNKIKDDFFEITGYDKEKIIKNITSLDNKGHFNTLVDLWEYSRGKLIVKLKLNLFFGEKTKWAKNKFIS